MYQGKYQSEYRRRSPAGIFIWLAIFALLVVGIAFVIKSCKQDDVTYNPTPETTLSNAGTTNTTQNADTNTTQSATADTTENTETPVTEETVEETTEGIPPLYDSTLGQNVVAAAKSTLGKAYALGGTGPDTFDTSGLVNYCFARCDIDAPRTIDSQFAHGIEVAKEFLQPGDVVFFSLETPDAAEYVGIYTGNDNFIAVSSSRNTVEERTMGSGYFAERFVGARRYE